MADPETTLLAYDRQLRKERRKGQVVGWAQGAAATFILMLLLKLVGWIPALLVLGVIGFLGYKLFGPDKEPSTA